MKFASIAIAAAIAAFGLTSTASAAQLSVIGSSQTFTLDGTPGDSFFNLVGTEPYDTLAPGFGFGTTLDIFDQVDKMAGNGLFVDSAANITFTFLGAEAGFDNIALVMGSTFVGNQISTPGASETLLSFGPGFLPFSFVSNTVAEIDNDAGANANVRIGFSPVFNGGHSVIAYFDDTFIQGIDYDDLVVRIDATPVPLPAAAWMLISAMAGMIFLGRRRHTA